MLTFIKNIARVCPTLGFDLRQRRFYAAIKTAIGERSAEGRTLEEAKRNLTAELSGMGQSRFLPDQLYMPVSGHRAGWIEIEVVQ